MKTIRQVGLFFLFLFSTYFATAQDSSTYALPFKANEHLWFIESGMSFTNKGAGTLSVSTAGSFPFHFALGHAYDVLPSVQVGGGLMIRGEVFQSGERYTSLPVFAQAQFSAAFRGDATAALFRFRFGYVPILEYGRGYPLIASDLGLRLRNEKGKVGAAVGLRFSYRNTNIYDRNYLGLFVQLDFYNQK